MEKSEFGKNPWGQRLERIKKSSNYKNGQFHNLNHTPAFGKNYTMSKVIYERLFKKYPRLRPTDSIPTNKTNIHQINPKENLLIWFGHSSYFIQIEGVKILVDPVFSKNASPIPNTAKPFKGTDVFGVEDFPSIDYLFISHDHYDHLDYKTVWALRDKVESVVCGLGVGSHLEYWGYQSEKIIERDWYEQINIKHGCNIFIEPARHFSGRGLVRNKTLWVSFVLKSPSLTLFLGGDSGYDTHYKAIGNKYGPFDLAILENGQYNEAWPYIHETPEEVLKAAQDLKAKRILPVHSSKFRLATHSWDEPLIKLSKLNESYNFQLVTPIIGEIVNLEMEDQKFKKWWEGMVK